MNASFYHDHAHLFESTVEIPGNSPSTRSRPPSFDANVEKRSSVTPFVMKMQQLDRTPGVVLAQQRLDQALGELKLPMSSNSTLSSCNDSTASVVVLPPILRIEPREGLINPIAHESKHRLHHHHHHQLGASPREAVSSSLSSPSHQDVIEQQALNFKPSRPVVHRNTNPRNQTTKIHHPDTIVSSRLSLLSPPEPTQSSSRSSTEQPRSHNPPLDWRMKIERLCGPQWVRISSQPGHPHHQLPMSVQQRCQAFRVIDRRRAALAELFAQETQTWTQELGAALRH